MIDRESKHLLFIALALLLLALCLDLFGYHNACISMQCLGGSLFWGSALTSSLFIFPGLLTYFYLPNKLRSKWFAIPLCMVFWVMWILAKAFLTDGEEFKPTAISVLSLIILYKLTTYKVKTD